MKNLLTAAMLLSLVLCLPACSKHPDCEGEGGALITFKGFDSTALEKVTITTFKAGSDFAEGIDADTFLLSAFSGMLQRYDTAAGFVTWPYYAPVGRKDVLITIASSGKTYRVTDITSTHAKNEQVGGFMNSGGASAKECHNVIESYKLDGKVIKTGASPAYGAGTGTNITITP